MTEFPRVYATARDEISLGLLLLLQTFRIPRGLFGIDTKTLSSCQIPSHFGSNAQSIKRKRNVESRSDSPGQFHKKNRRSGPKLLVWRICTVRRGEPRMRDELWRRRPRAEAGGVVKAAG
jgi:hypothetical protein